MPVPPPNWKDTAREWMLSIECVTDGSQGWKWFEQGEMKSVTRIYGPGVNTLNNYRKIYLKHTNREMVGMLIDGMHAVDVILRAKNGDRGLSFKSNQKKEDDLEQRRMSERVKGAIEAVAYHLQNDHSAN
ncbi:hypothetical protein G7K_6878-t1 [Saitoella complicata NRRL Y-17804]|uniref:Uncharacterized protein n=1 Tax=Saitoella complicata (strain BCRC 22490 / CBS 7301 / JCM 7358 / NBRC 10748 / NRRL Y-17804) TaxID=698492 RepID=A0A0E9NT02_SAICN|nr:hypothetical protein G7K_6878-t1 [Saitoella complicata NRRL Y-17804]